MLGTQAADLNNSPIAYQVHFWEIKHNKHSYKRVNIIHQKEVSNCMPFRIQKTHKDEHHHSIMQYLAQKSLT